MIETAAPSFNNRQSAIGNYTSARDPPEPDEPVFEPWLDDPFPDYDHEPVFAHN